VSRAQARRLPGPRVRRGLLAAVVLLVVVLAAASRREAARDPVPAAPPGLADLWSGRARLVFDRKWTSASLGQPAGGAYASAQVVVAGGRWYLFNRRSDGRACGSTQASGTQVRESPDGGRTWGPPVPIVLPTAGTPWECVAADGGVAYDAAAGTWRFLFQCMAATGGWQGCYAERRGPSPLGPFTAPAAHPNPVIAAGQLWSRICAEAHDACARQPGQAPIVDEGTFDLVPAPGGDWWVSFHGYDGAHAFRGIARTRTFRPDGWQVDGAGGTPRDAVITAADAAGWREHWQAGGPVGPGAGRMAAQGGWYYMVAEVPDVSLGCRAGQNWDLGLFRARDPAATTWEQYPGGNPVVYSSQAPDSSGSSPHCNVEYPGLFSDPSTGRTYLLHGRISGDPAYDGIYVYRLEWDRNLLDNADLWRGDAQGWHPFAGTSTQIAVPRSPDGSPDGTPYLAFSCGAATCDGGQSVYQDVAVTDRIRGTTVAFGGSLRADAGGRVDVALIQIGPAGEVLHSDVVTVGATAAYAATRGRATVDDRAVRLRLELYPRSPGGFRADDLYVIPDAGCARPAYPAC
jgi:hypothetical protein